MHSKSVNELRQDIKGIQLCPYPEVNQKENRRLGRGGYSHNSCSPFSSVLAILEPWADTQRVNLRSYMSEHFETRREKEKRRGGLVFDGGGLREY